jgi:5-formyltetrahydrofolate cyclo-ligase
MDDILLEKKRLRSEVLKTRVELPEEKIRRDSKTIIDKLMRLDSYQKSATISCFIDFKQEVITRDLIKSSLEAGKRVLVPVIVKEPDGSKLMKASQLLDLEHDLESGTMGILEPKQECRRFVEPSEIDFFVVPGLAFDVHKNRLGYGAGYHDAVLKKLRPGCDTVAVCFDFQLFDHIPVKEYDIRVKKILTELRTIE